MNDAALSLNMKEEVNRNFIKQGRLDEPKHKKREWEGFLRIGIWTAMAGDRVVNEH